MTTTPTGQRVPTVTTGSATVNGAASQAVGAERTEAVPEGLYQKLATIAKQARDEGIEATGKLQHGDKKVYSIGDVEAAIGPLCADAGIVTRWSSVSLDSYEQATSNGTMRMWISHLRVKVTDAASAESFEDDWIDIGTNPMAAASFVRKGYYKALFHLAEESDEAKGEAPAAGGGQTATARASSAPQTAATPPRADRPIVGEKLPCEACAMAGYKNRKGYAAVIWPDRLDCDGVDAEGDAQRHKRKVDVSTIPEPQTFADGSPIPDEIPFA
jgi:hypothetical protein